MSCLPLFTFSQSLPLKVLPGNDTSTSKLVGQAPKTPAMTPKTIDDFDTPYDKLSRVSISHRRVDSFEWVMTQSAPNTPSTVSGSQYQPYTPPPARVIGSAPLPVPNEHWSTGTRPVQGSAKRSAKQSFFDWWTSPSPSNACGYTKILEVEEPEASTSVRVSKTEPSRPPLHRAHTSPEPPITLDNHLRPTHELNALGIVLPSIPPVSAPTSILEKPDPITSSPNEVPRVSVARLPKRVSFSPIIDEVFLEAFPDSKPSGPQESPWGSYLPSSFLVARPPMPRNNSSPAPRSKSPARTILKHSISVDPQQIQGSRPSTEMTCLQFQPSVMDKPNAMTAASPIPTGRLLAMAARNNMGRTIDDESGNTDKAFADLLQITPKKGRQRCDSLLSGSPGGPLEKTFGQ